MNTNFPNNFVVEDVKGYQAHDLLKRYHDLVDEGVIEELDVSGQTHWEAYHNEFQYLQQVFSSEEINDIMDKAQARHEQDMEEQLDYINAYQAEHEEKLKDVYNLLKEYF